MKTRQTTFGDDRISNWHDNLLVYKDGKSVLVSANHNLFGYASLFLCRDKHDKCWGYVGESINHEDDLAGFDAFPWLRITRFYAGISEKFAREVLDDLKPWNNGKQDECRHLQCYRVEEFLDKKLVSNSTFYRLR